MSSMLKVREYAFDGDLVELLSLYNCEDPVIRQYVRNWFVCNNFKFDNTDHKTALNLLSMCREHLPEVSKSLESMIRHFEYCTFQVDRFTKIFQLDLDHNIYNKLEVHKVPNQHNVLVCLDHMLDRWGGTCLMVELFFYREDLDEFTGEWVFRKNGPVNRLEYEYQRALDDDEDFVYDVDDYQKRFDASIAAKEADFLRGFGFDV